MVESDTMIPRCLALGLLAASAAPATAAVYITEWMYDGSEFIEFTNTGALPVDFTGWSYDDDSRSPGTFDLSAFGLVAPGESVILAEVSAADFRTEWGLSESVKVIGGLTVNLGRNDEINLFNAANELVDRLTYGDNQTAPGSIRTQEASGFTLPPNYGANDVFGWQLSVAGEDGAYTSVSGYVGSPGIAAIPEPSAVMFSLLACCGLLRRQRA